jgi:hypothetical protein
MQKHILAQFLKSSLSAEREAVKLKHATFVEDRFAKAEKFFDTGGLSQSAPEDKVIRDTFSMPEDDYNLINVCKSRLLKQGNSSNKSEIIRAGLIILNKLSDVELLNALAQIKKVKTGRPKFP